MMSCPVVIDHLQSVFEIPLEKVLLAIPTPCLRPLEKVLLAIPTPRLRLRLVSRVYVRRVINPG